MDKIVIRGGNPLLARRISGRRTPPCLHGSGSAHRRTGDSRKHSSGARHRDHTQAPRRHGADVELGYGELITAPRFAPHPGAPEASYELVKTMRARPRPGAARRALWPAAFVARRMRHRRRPIDSISKVSSAGRRLRRSTATSRHRRSQKAVGSKG